MPNKPRLSADSKAVIVGGKWIIHDSSCCETCSHCEDSEAPQAFKVKFNGISNKAGGCNDCADYNISYCCPNTTTCTWTTTTGVPTTCYGASGSDGPLIRVSGGTSAYVFDVSYVLEGALVYAFYRDATGSTAPDCDAFNEKSIGITSDALGSACDGTGSTVDVTAL
jgi:hypothetical protein